MRHLQRRGGRRRYSRPIATKIRRLALDLPRVRGGVGTARNLRTLRAGAVTCRWGVTASSKCCGCLRVVVAKECEPLLLHPLRCGIGLANQGARPPPHRLPREYARERGIRNAPEKVKSRPMAQRCGSFTNDPCEDPTLGTSLPRLFGGGVGTARNLRWLRAGAVTCRWG